MIADMKLGTRTSRGRYKTTRKFTVDGATYKKEFVQRQNESIRSVNQRANDWQSTNRGKRISPFRTIASVSELYMEYRQGDSIQPVTLKDDQYAAGLLTNLLGTVDVSKVDPVGVELALRTWAHKPRTAKKIRDFGRKLFTWLNKRGWTDSNPFAQAKPVPYEPDVWQEPMKPEHFEAAIAHVKNQNLRAMYLLLRWTGIRPKSARELLWSEVLDDQRMFVKKSTAKTRASLAPMYVPDEAASEIRALPKTSPLVFPSPRGGAWSAKNIGERWNEAQSKAGLVPRVLYDLKHLRATELTATLGRTDAAAALGIKNPQVLDKHYVQIDREALTKRLESRPKGMNKV